MARKKTTDWQNNLYEKLREHRVTQFAYVPDAGPAC